MAGRTLTVYLAVDSRSAARNVDTFGSKLKGMGKLLLAGGIAAGIYGLARGFQALTEYISDSIGAAEKAESANARLDNVLSQMGFSDASERLKEYADALQFQVAVEDESIKAVQAKLATFGELTKSVDEAGGSFDRATLAALDLAATGFGSAESNATQLGKALQDPVKGLTSLSRAGVTFTDAERDRIAALVESNKIGKAQELILDAIEEQVGGTAAATADASDKMSLAWQEIQEEIGTALLPAFQDLTAWVVDDLVPAFREWWEDAGPKVTQAVEDLWSWITNDLMPAVEDMWETMQRDLFPVMRDLADLFSDLTDTVMDFVNELGLSDEASDENSDSLSWLSGIVQGLGYWVGLLKSVWTILSTYLRYGLSVWTAVWKGIQKVWDWVQNLQAAFSDLVAYLLGLYSELWTIGRQIVDGLLGGIKAAWETLVSWWNNSVGGLIDGAKSILGIQSPSRVFAEIGGDVVDGFRIGLQGLDGVSDEVAEKLGNLVDKSVDRLNGFAADAKAALDDARSAMRDYRDSIADTITGTLDLGQAWNTAQNSDGATSFWDAFTEQARSAENFAALLSELVDSGASQELIDQVAAMGPAAGAALAEEMLGKGLVTEANRIIRHLDIIGEGEGKYIARQFFGPGVEAANNLLAGLDAAIAKETKKLRQLGKAMGVEISVGLTSALQSSLDRFTRSAAPTRSTRSAPATAAGPVVLQIDGRTLGTVVVDQLQAYTAANGAIRGVRLAS